MTKLSKETQEALEAWLGHRGAIAVERDAASRAWLVTSEHGTSWRFYDGDGEQTAYTYKVSRSER